MRRRLRDRLRQILAAAGWGRPRRGGPGLLAAAAVALVCAVVSAQAPRDSRIFRLVSFESGGEARLGATEGNGDADIVDVHRAVLALAAAGAPEVRDLAYVPPDMKGLIQAGSPAVAAVKTVYRTALAARAARQIRDDGGDRVFYPPRSVRILTPIGNPSKVFGTAGNYPREGANASPQYPSFFFKSVASLIGQDEVIDLKGLITTGVHEGEMAFIIGAPARNVPEDRAFDYVFGYTIHDDVTARDWPSGKHTSQGSMMDKGVDTFGPTGPYITLKEDVPDPHNLAIQVKLNGEVWPVPNANTRFLTFKIPQLVAFLSRRITLLPGDIVSTGVPAPVVPLRAGDRVEVTVERLGTLRSRVVADASAASSR